MHSRKQPMNHGIIKSWTNPFWSPDHQLSYTRHSIRSDTQEQYFILHDHWYAKSNVEQRSEGSDHWRRSVHFSLDFFCSRLICNLQEHMETPLAS